MTDEEKMAAELRRGQKKRNKILNYMQKQMF